jgi:hypothetical protein
MNPPRSTSGFSCVPRGCGAATTSPKHDSGGRLRIRKRGSAAAVLTMPPEPRSLMLARRGQAGRGPVRQGMGPAGRGKVRQGMGGAAATSPPNFTSDTEFRTRPSKNPTDTRNAAMVARSDRGRVVSASRERGATATPRNFCPPLHLYDGQDPHHTARAFIRSARSQQLPEAGASRAGSPTGASGQQSSRARH